VYGLEHGIRFAKNFVVPEPQRTKALACEPRVSVRVACATGVLSAVRFNDELVLEAHEVRDVATNRFLSAELCSDESARAQLSPETVFGIRHRLP
jgi:hypothetical protein